MSNEKQDALYNMYVCVRVYVCVCYICTHKQKYFTFSEVLEVNLNNIQDVDHTPDILNEVPWPRHILS